MEIDSFGDTVIIRHESRSFFLLQPEHFVVCQYEDVTCDDCEGKMQKRLLHEHTRSECPNRIVQCEYCEEEFAFCSTKVRLLYLCKRTSKSHTRISRFRPRHVCIYQNQISNLLLTRVYNCWPVIEPARTALGSRRAWMHLRSLGDAFPRWLGTAFRCYNCKNKQKTSRSLDPIGVKVILGQFWCHFGHPTALFNINFGNKSSARNCASLTPDNLTMQRKSEKKGYIDHELKRVLFVSNYNWNRDESFSFFNLCVVLCGWFNCFSHSVLAYVNSFMKKTSVHVFLWNVVKDVDCRFPGRR